MDEVRRLSFRLSDHEKQLRSHAERLDSIDQQVKKATHLKKEYQSKSQKLSKKIRQMKNVTTF